MLEDGFVQRVCIQALFAGEDSVFAEAGASFVGRVFHDIILTLEKPK